MNDLKKFAAATPFELGDLARASQTLQSFGVQNQKLMPDIKMLGDISQGNKEKFNGLSLVFGQVASQGKLMGGDLLQMINNGFNPLQVMSQKTGKSMSQLKDEMSKGKISFKDVEDAMVTATSKGGMFYGAMEKQSTTFAGKMSTLKDNFNEFAGVVSKPIFDFLKNGMDGAMKIMQNLQPKVQHFIDDLGKGADVFTSFEDAFGTDTYNKVMAVVSALTGVGVAIAGFKIQSMVTGVASFVTGLISMVKATEGATIAQKLFNLAMESNPIGIIIGLISSLVAGIVYLWTTNEHFRAVVVGIWDSIKAYFTTVVSLWSNIFTVQIPGFIRGVITWFEQLPGRIWGALTGAINYVRNWGMMVWGYLSVEVPRWISGIFNWFNQLPGRLGTALGTALGRITRWGIDSWNYLTTNVPKWINGIGQWFAQLPGKIGQWLSSTFTKVVSWGSQMFSKAIEVGSKFLSNIVSFYVQLPGKIGQWLLNTVSKASEFVHNLGQKAVEAGRTFTNNIVDGVKSIPGKMVSIGKDIVEGIWHGIGNAGSWLSDKIHSFASGVVNGFEKAMGIKSPSTVMSDRIGKFMAQGVGVGFTDELDSVKTDMSSSMSTFADSGLVKSFNNNLTVNQNDRGQDQQTQQPIIIQIDGKEVFRALSPRMAMAGLGVR